LIGGGGVGCALHPNSRITDAAASGSNHFMVIGNFPILHPENLVVVVKDFLVCHSLHFMSDFQVGVTFFITGSNLM
jgi:hypothetical protein